MNANERLHRPDPVRTGPLRNAAHYLRDPGPAPASAPFPDKVPPPAECADDATVAQGVRAGYAVIEEHIRQGHRLAQRLGQSGDRPGQAAPDGGSAAAAGDIGALIERSLNLCKDLGALCVDAVETLARSPDLLQAALARVMPAPTATGSGPGQAVTVEVVSSRRTQVALQLPATPQPGTPLVHALHAADPAIAPLTGARFATDPASGRQILIVEVPDAQQAATYTGVVVDSSTNEPRGSLCVRVFA